LSIATKQICDLLMGLFNRIAHRYDGIVGSFDIDSILTYLPLNEEVLLLDLGGGTGRVSFHLLEHVKECLIIDISNEMLTQAKKKTSQFLLAQGTAGKIPLRSNSIKQIFLNDSLHHIREQKETIAECYRILQKGGELYIREFNRKYFWNIFLIIGEALLCFKSKFYSPKELTKVCEDVGFEVTIVRRRKGTFLLKASKVL